MGQTPKNTKLRTPVNWNTFKTQICKHRMLVDWHPLFYREHRMLTGNFWYIEHRMQMRHHYILQNRGHRKLAESKRNICIFKGKSGTTSLPAIRWPKYGLEWRCPISYFRWARNFSRFTTQFLGCSVTKLKIYKEVLKCYNWLVDKFGVVAEKRSDTKQRYRTPAGPVDIRHWGIDIWI